MAETSTKPYLIRAIHEWCSDNGFTPYIAVAVDARTTVPREFVRNGEIVLNVSMMATNRLQLGNDLIEFQARFNGTPRELSIPVENVSAIYARENGHGMAFEVPKAGAVTEADAPRVPVSVEPSPAPSEAPFSAEGAPATLASDPSVTPSPAPRNVPATPVPLGAVPPPSERPRARPALRPAAPGKGEGRGEGGRGRGKQVLAVVPDAAEPKPDRADVGSPGAGSDAPRDPDDNPPKPSPPRLTRIK